MSSPPRFCENKCGTPNKQGWYSVVKRIERDSNPRGTAKHPLVFKTSAFSHSATYPNTAKLGLADAEALGLEPKTSDSETDVLPITPRLIKPISNYGAGVTGFEPVTSAFKARGVASYTIPHRGLATLLGLRAPSPTVRNRKETLGIIAISTLAGILLRCNSRSVTFGRCFLLVPRNHHTLVWRADKSPSKSSQQLPRFR